MIITLTGSNSFQLKEQLRELVEDFTHEHGDIAVERIDGQDVAFERLLDSLQSLPFLVNKKMVVLREPGAHKQFTEYTKDLLQGLPDNTDVIIVEPKLDKRLTYYKTLKTQTDFQEFGDLDPSALSKWLVQRAKSLSGDLTLTNATFLIDRVGSNQQLLAHELDKLLAFSPEVSRENIEKLTDTTPQSTIFELLDAVFAGNRRRTLQLYQEQRIQKVEPQKIISMIVWQLYILSLVITAGNRSANEIAKETHVKPYVINKTLSLARRLDIKSVKHLIQDTLSLDVRLKTQSIDADEALQYFLLSVIS